MKSRLWQLFHAFPGPRAPPLRKAFSYRAPIHAPAARVFPLLCPMRELEWIAGWQAKVVYSRSGVAEDNAVFSTRLMAGETWVTSRYEPAELRVEYTIFAGRHAVLRLDLALEDGASAEACQLAMKRTYTSLDWLGRRMVEKTTQQEMDAEHARLARQLDHFVVHGTRLEGGR